MKIIKKEILRILFVLSVQLVVSFLIFYFSNKPWNVRTLICNYTFLAFWGSYLVCSVLIALFKKYIKDK